MANGWEAAVTRAGRSLLISHQRKAMCSLHIDPRGISRCCCERCREGEGRGAGQCGCGWVTLCRMQCRPSSSGPVQRAGAWWHLQAPPVHRHRRISLQRAQPETLACESSRTVHPSRCQIWCSSTHSHSPAKLESRSTPSRASFPHAPWPALPFAPHSHPPPSSN